MERGFNVRAQAFRFVPAAVSCHGVVPNSIPARNGSLSRSVYVRPVFRGANPSNATFGSGAGGSFRAYRWIEVAGDFSVYLGTSGVANNTTLFLTTWLVRDFPRRSPDRLGSHRSVISWLAGKPFTTAAPNTRLTTETGAALRWLETLEWIFV
jgi:hypothetical protein